MSDKQELDIKLNDTKEESEVTQKRRALVASIAAVGASTALPTEWKKPVIDSMFLPAHAQTSVTDPTTGNTGTDTNGGGITTTPTAGATSTTTTVVTASQVSSGSAGCDVQFANTGTFETFASSSATGTSEAFGTVSAGNNLLCTDPNGATFTAFSSSGTFTTTVSFAISEGFTLTNITTGGGMFSTTSFVSFTTSVTQTAVTTVS